MYEGILHTNIVHTLNLHAQLYGQYYGFARGATLAHVTGVKFVFATFNFTSDVWNILPAPS